MTWLIVTILILAPTLTLAIGLLVRSERRWQAAAQERAALWEAVETAAAIGTMLPRQSHQGETQPPRGRRHLRVIQGGLGAVAGAVLAAGLWASKHPRSVAVAGAGTTAGLSVLTALALPSGGPAELGEPPGIEASPTTSPAPAAPPKPPTPRGPPPVARRQATTTPGDPSSPSSAPASPAAPGPTTTAQPSPTPSPGPPSAEPPPPSAEPHEQCLVDLELLRIDIEICLRQSGAA